MWTKEDFLDAVKREAQENNGVPLGKLRFEKATGIKESDWSGVYWAKWSDAILEAGLSPNSLQAALPLEQLLERYARLIGELRHFPTVAERRLKARQDDTFPAHTTFSNRLGNKGQQIRALVEFCSKTDGFEELIPLLEQEGQSFRSADDGEAKNTYDQTGYVYLMKFGLDYKIGHSKNVQKRLQQLRTQMPHEGEIIHMITTGDPEGIEAYWHQYFADRRLKGEWFKLTVADIRYFRRRKLM